MLTSDLVVSDPNSDGIFIATPPVTIDLNGFEIRGPVSCTGLGSTLSCGAGTGRGIRAEGRPRITVVNGSVIQFGSDGILVASRSRIDGVVVERNGGDGVRTGADSLVTNVRSYRNAGDGIDVGDSSTVKLCTSASNGQNGVLTGTAALVSESTARDNGTNGVLIFSRTVVSKVVASGNEEVGISGSTGCTIQDSSTYDNGSVGIFSNTASSILRNTSTGNAVHGIRATRTSLIMGTVASANGESGIEAVFDRSVVGNQIFENLGFALRLRESTTYRDNTIMENTLGGIENFVGASPPGVDLGGNYCAGPLRRDLDTPVRLRRGVGRVALGHESRRLLVLTMDACNFGARALR